MITTGILFLVSFLAVYSIRFANKKAINGNLFMPQNVEFVQCRPKACARIVETSKPGANYTKFEVVYLKFNSEVWQGRGLKLRKVNLRSFEPRSDHLVDLSWWLFQASFAITHRGLQS